MQETLTTKNMAEKGPFDEFEEVVEVSDKSFPKSIKDALEAEILKQDTSDDEYYAKESSSDSF